MTTINGIRADMRNIGPGQRFLYHLDRGRLVVGMAPELADPFRPCLHRTVDDLAPCPKEGCDGHVVRVSLYGRGGRSLIWPTDCCSVCTTVEEVRDVLREVGCGAGVDDEP